MNAEIISLVSKNEELYEEINHYINQFINSKCNKDRLNYNYYATIKEFIETNDVRYNYEFFCEYLNYNS